MRAKFGRDPTAGSKILSFKFISRSANLGRDRFASSGRGISSAGSRIVAHETIDKTETGRRWLTMFTLLRLQLKYKNG